MRADSFSVPVDDFSRPDSVRRSSSQEFAVVFPSQETDSHALGRFQPGRKSLSGFAFQRFSHRGDRPLEAGLRDAPKVIGLILGRIGRLAHEHFAVLSRQAKIMACGDTSDSSFDRDVAQRVPLDAGVAFRTGGRRFSGQVAACEIVHDLPGEGSPHVGRKKRRIQCLGGPPGPSQQGTVAGHVQREKRRLVAMSAENPDGCTAVVTSAECQEYPSFATHAFGVR